MGSCEEQVKEQEGRAINDAAVCVESAACGQDHGHAALCGMPAFPWTSCGGLSRMLNLPEP